MDEKKKGVYKGQTTFTQVRETNMTNERQTTFSDKAGPCKGCIRDGLITVWRKDMAKKEFSFSVTVGEIEARLCLFYNPNWVFF